MTPTPASPTPANPAPSNELDNRRPIATRRAGWVHWLAAQAAAGHANPDLISGCGLAFGLMGGALLMATGDVRVPIVRGMMLLGVVAAIQLRLLCNLLDGMVAVEHGRGGSAGPIWNELPDRFSDVALLAGAGYCATASGVLFGIEVGWLAAALALICAYVRELGRGMGFPADFSGPMAKQQRMAVLTAACLVAVVEPAWGWRGQSLVIGLAIIALGAAVTVWRRTRTLAGRLSERHGPDREQEGR